ncbi:hypothetical protein A7J67_18550 [Achromobacter xylosoxidans]|nr:hypothetical protein A7J67_18550 [Achromobacter xylosoxidans]
MVTSQADPAAKPKKNFVRRRRSSGKKVIQIVVPNETDNRSKDWKNHPVLIAVISAAATATFFQTVVIPISDASNRAELVESRKAKETHEQVAKALAEQEKRNAQLGKDLAISQQANLFVAGNPYPVGYRVTPIGVPLAKVKEHFKDRDLADERSILSVRQEKGVIRRASYHYESTGGESIVTHVSYAMAFGEDLWGTEDAEKLRAILIETFGPPTEVQADVGARWRISSAGQSYWLYLASDFPMVTVTDIKATIRMW